MLPRAGPVSPDHECGIGKNPALMGLHPHLDNAKVARGQDPWRHGLLLCQLLIPVYLWLRLRHGRTFSLATAWPSTSAIARACRRSARKGIGGGSLTLVNLEGGMEVRKDSAAPLTLHRRMG
jgi:hypothetical protein